MADKVDNLEIDFLIQGEVANFAVERKEFKDLKASLTGDERLWQQVDTLKQLREQGYTSFVACIGSEWFFMDKCHIMTEEQYIGIQIGIARNKVNFIHINTDGAFHKFLCNLNERSGTAREYVRPTIHKPERTILEERADMISAVKGIGMKTATKLAQEAGSITNLCALTAIDHPPIMSLLNKNTKVHLKEVLHGQ